MANAKVLPNIEYYCVFIYPGTFITLSGKEKDKGGYVPKLKAGKGAAG